MEQEKQTVFDKQDLMIVSRLRKDAREKLTIMAKRIDLPVSTIYDRIGWLNQNIIMKRTSLLNFPKIGYNARAMFVLKVNRDQRDEVKKFLLKQQGINNLYKINNGYDFLAEMVFRHVKEMEDFTEDLENKFNILQKNIYYVIEDVERECFMDADKMTWLKMK